MGTAWLRYNVSMDEKTRTQIRGLLKRFGIAADEAISAHLQKNRPGQIRVRLILEDRTDYGDHPPGSPLSLEIEGSIEG